jgi:hypothetical protein
MRRRGLVALALADTAVLAAACVPNSTLASERVTNWTPSGIALPQHGVRIRTSVAAQPASRDHAARLGAPL